MNINTFLLFIAFAIFCAMNFYANLHTSNIVTKRQSYLLSGIGLCGMLYILIMSLK